MNKDKNSLSIWIEQHLFEKEQERLRSTPEGARAFAWHKPSANDLLPSSKINVTPVDLNVPIEFIKE